MGLGKGGKGSAGGAGVPRGPGLHFTPSYKYTGILSPATECLQKTPMAGRSKGLCGGTVERTEHAERAEECGGVGGGVRVRVAWMCGKAVPISGKLRSWLQRQFVAT